jgi:hypothetical protein
VARLAPGGADATAPGVDAERQLERLLALARDDHVLDEIIFETVSTRLGDFAEFGRQVLQAMPPVRSDVSGTSSF